MGSTDGSLADNGSPSVKRKRSPSADGPPAPAKVAKTNNSHLHINYLTKLYSDTLPLISVDDSLRTLLPLVQDYDGILQRHESMAGNLGARPLGPILIKKFERLFDGPPKVLRSHGKEGTNIGWLDVVEFAKNKPQQFNLEKTRDGVRVCQFYTKQSRVEITEEDYELIASGIPEKLIPPQPIPEDEEKELGTLEILVKKMEDIVQLADQVSARARQLNHRLKHRQKAINSRREGASASFSPRSAASNFAEKGQITNSANGDTRTSMSPSSGFTAVNSRPSEHTNGHTSSYGASPAVRAELESKFFTNSQRTFACQEYEPSRRTPNLPTSHSNGPDVRFKSRSAAEPDYLSATMHSASPKPVPIPNTPSSLLQYVKSSAGDRNDDSGPYKAEMVSRMELLQRGDRVVPPCDRCRRLHMDCLKNLTACLGCTKKHAKCSWKDVTDAELQNYVPPEPLRPGLDEGLSERSTSRPAVDKQKIRYPTEGVPDEELLGEESDELVSEAEAPNDDGRDSPIQVHVAGSLQTADGTPIEREDFEDPDVDMDMEPEVKQDIINLQKSDTAGLPSPPSAPIPPPASLPEMPAIRSEAPPDLKMEDAKSADLGVLASDTIPGNTEYGTSSNANGNGTDKEHDLPGLAADILAQATVPVENQTLLQQAIQGSGAKVANSSTSAPSAGMAPVALMGNGNHLDRTEG